MAGQAVGVVGSARQQDGRVAGAFGDNDDGVQLDAVAHGNHDLALDVIKAVGDRLELGGSFAGQGGVLRLRWRLRHSSSQAQGDDGNQPAKALLDGHSEKSSPSQREFSVAAHKRVRHRAAKKQARRCRQRAMEWHPRSVLAVLHNYYKPRPLALVPSKYRFTLRMAMGRIARDRTFREPLNPVTTFFMAAFHVGAIAALFFFSWKGLALAAFLWWVTGSLGIGMGYHRLLTHRGFKCPKWVEYFLTTCGALTLEGGPMYWVATHRVHHQNSDKEGDPHTPFDGGFWSHIGWIITGRTLHNDCGNILPYVPDLRKDKFHTWMSKWHWVPIVALGLIILAVGGWSCFLWGMFFRTTVGLHATFLVNSATHMWGRQRFLT